MKRILFACAALMLIGNGPLEGPAGSTITTVGGNSATACYHAALVGDASTAAFTHCDRALNADVIPFDDLVATYVNRGVLSLVNKDFRSAEADFDKAMALQAKQPEAWLNKGIARYNQGDARAAVELFSKALELRTSHAPLAYFGRGLANEDVGDARAAYEDIRRASELDPTWDPPRQELKRFKVVPKATALG